MNPSRSDHHLAILTQYHMGPMSRQREHTDYKPFFKGQHVRLNWKCGIVFPKQSSLDLFFFEVGRFDCSCWSSLHDPDMIGICLRWVLGSPSFFQVVFSEVYIFRDMYKFLLPVVALFEFVSYQHSTLCKTKVILAIITNDTFMQPLQNFKGIFQYLPLWIISVT